MEISLKNKSTLLGVLLAVALIFGLGFKLGGTAFTDPYATTLKSEQTAQTSKGDNLDSQSLETDTQNFQANPETQVAKRVYVHVTGAVKNPGLYDFPEGTRVAEAVKRAQPLPSADINLLNLAVLLYDQQQVVVPAKGTLGSGPATTTSAGKSLGKVSINNAPLEELDSLPGIGPALAERIMEYRKSHGGFKRIEELKDVSGIGEQKFSKLKDQVTL